MMVDCWILEVFEGITHCNLGAMCSGLKIGGMKNVKEDGMVQSITTLYNNQKAYGNDGKNAHET